MTILLTYLTYRGLDVVGNIAVILCLLSLSPFVVFCIIGIWKVKPSRWLEGPARGTGSIFDVDWRLLLNTFFWNINYWESSATFSAEVENPGMCSFSHNSQFMCPGRTFPKGLAIAVLLVAVSGFFPILIGTGASSANYNEWTDGYFVHLSTEIVGSWLGTSMGMNSVHFIVPIRYMDDTRCCFDKHRNVCC